MTTGRTNKYINIRHIATTIILILFSLMSVIGAPSYETSEFAVSMHRSSIPTRRTMRIPQTMMHTQYAKERARGMHTMDDPDTGASFAVPLTGCPFNDFMIPVRIGQQAFHMIVDTGSTTVAVASVTCTTCGGATPAYSPGPKAQRLGSPVDASFGDSSSFGGTLMKDDVALLNAQGIPVTPDVSIKFAMITKASTGRNAFFLNDVCFHDGQHGSPEDSYQGVFGLSFQELAKGGTDGFLEKWHQQHPSTPSKYALQMCLHSGELWFQSGIPTSPVDQAFRKTYAGRMHYIPLKSHTGLIQVPLDSVRLGDRSIVEALVRRASQGGGGGGGGGIYSILDSGTSLWWVPSSIYRAIVHELDNNAYFKKYFTNMVHMADCRPLPEGAPSVEEMNRNLPRVTLTFEQFSETAPGQHRPGGSIGGSRPGAKGGTGPSSVANVTLTLPAMGTYLLPCDSSRTTWQSGLVETDREMMLLGWPIMNHFVTEIDLTEKIVGFAQSVKCPEQQDSTTDVTNPSRGYVTGSSIDGACGTGDVSTECADEIPQTGTPSTNPNPSNPSHPTVTTPPLRAGETCPSNYCQDSISASGVALGIAVGTCGCVARGATCLRGCAEGWVVKTSRAFVCQEEPAMPTGVFLTGGTQSCRLNGTDEGTTTGGAEPQPQPPQPQPQAQSSTGASAHSSNPHFSTASSSTPAVPNTPGVSSTGGKDITPPAAAISSTGSSILLSSTGASSVDRSSTGSPASHPTTPSTDAWSITLRTSYSYAAYSADKQGFKTLFLFDLEQALGLKSERVAQLEVLKETVQGTQSNRLHTLADSSNEPDGTVKISFLILPSTSTADRTPTEFLVEMQSQIQTEGSKLRSGVVTKSIVAIAASTKSRCKDETYAEPCPSDLGVDNHDGSGVAGESYPWYFYPVVALAVVLFLLACWLVKRTCCSSTASSSEDDSSASNTPSASKAARKKAQKAIAAKKKKPSAASKKQYATLEQNGGEEDGEGEDAEGEDGSNHSPKMHAISAEPEDGEAEEEEEDPDEPSMVSRTEISHTSPKSASQIELVQVQVDSLSESAVEEMDLPYEEEEEDEGNGAFTNSDLEEPEVVEWKS